MGGSFLLRLFGFEGWGARIAWVVVALAIIAVPVLHQLATPGTTLYLPEFAIGLVGKWMCLAVLALSIDLVASASSEQRPQLVRLLLDDVLAEICPTLKVRPAECTLDAASVPSAKQPAVVRAILRGAFPELTAAQRAELADRVLRDR